MPSRDRLSPVKQALKDAVGTVCPAAQLVVRWRDGVVLALAEGWLDPDRMQYPTQPDTLFDLASLTKLFTTTTFMTLVEAGDVALDQPVYTILPELGERRLIKPYEDPLNPGEFVTVYSPSQFAECLATEAGGVGQETSPNEKGDRFAAGSSSFAAGLPTEVDARHVTFRHLLTHSAGLPAWRPLYQQPTIEAARQLALHTFFSYPPGTRVVYSDIGLILVGLSIERLTGQSLPAAMQERVLSPLNLQHTRYLSISVSQKLEKPVRQRSPDRGAKVRRRSPDRGAKVRQRSPDRGAKTRSRDLTRQERAALLNIAPTEFCHWRKRRIVGEVHDENAWRLGGVAGHAGLFSTAHDVATLGQRFLDGGAPLLSPETVVEMTSLQAEDGHSRRGLGFGLWISDPEASGNPFSQRAFGHTGFTGTSLWIDPARDLVVVLLTNEVYNGREGREILTLRVKIHRAVVDAIDALAEDPCAFAEDL